jgi:FKBP-type peptidyl-prolyl cis-trans isomerase 2
MKGLLHFGKYLPLVLFFILFTFFWGCMMDKTVKNWDLIVVDYVWKHLDWIVFDTSIKSVAEEAWIYNPQRDYEAWLEFTAGGGQMIKWFDEAVIWMKVWESKTVEIPAEKAYGERSEDYVIHVPLSEAWDISWAEVGMQVILWGMYPAKIADITDSEIVYDANHELAWETLVFDITIKSIEE